jgi:carbonic anhydrase
LTLRQRMIYPTARTVFGLVLLRLYSTQTRIGAQLVDYGVYFNTTNGLPNPFGQGFYPQSQKSWNLVEKPTYPIFLDWGKYLDDPSKWNVGNQCQDRSSATYSTAHNQSPIKLQGDFKCGDFHRTRVKDPGQCAQNETRFYTTPYGLGVDTTKCKRYWKYDHSRNSDPWFLQEIRITTPSEHTVRNATNGAEIQYVGELQLAFKGTGGHSASIAITSIFLVLSPSDASNAEIEKLLLGWENYQNKVYKNCNKTFNNQTCSLVPIVSSPVQAPRKPVLPPKRPSRPMPLPFKPLPKPARSPLTQPKFQPVKNPAAKPIVAPVKRRFLQYKKGMQDEGTDAIPSNSTAAKRLDRELSDGCWTGGGCPDSYYCFPNLYWQAPDGNESHHHWRYYGSLSYPPCTENVEWRVMFGTLNISKNQRERIDALIYKHLDPTKCTLATVGSPRGDPTKCKCCVNTNRMRQSLSYQMYLEQCSEWASTAVLPTLNSTEPNLPKLRLPQLKEEEPPS